MRRFLITSPAFTGQAEIIYNALGLLIKIDVTNTNMGGLDCTEFRKSIQSLKLKL